MKNGIIQVVDDNTRNRNICREILEFADFEVIEAENGEVGLQIALKERPDVILLDIMMPVMDGMEMIGQLRSTPELMHVPVLMLTAKSSTDHVVQALDAGANDYLIKPFSDEELEARVKTLYRMKTAEDQIRNQNEILEEKVRQRTAELNETQIEIVHRLGMAAEYRDNETGSHILRMSSMCKELGALSGMNSTQQELLLNASPMHDIGKISIPDSVLLKPGKLTLDEWNIMMTHTSVGGKLLDGHDSSLMILARDIALTHHENWDGQGYPERLKGEEILLEGRIASIADVFDSLTSKRPYKNPYPIDFAFKIIKEERGKQFDPELTDLFLANKDIFTDIKQYYSDENIITSDSFELSERDKEKQNDR